MEGPCASTKWATRNKIGGLTDYPKENDEANGGPV